MLLVLITFTLITVGVVSFLAGAWMISRYAFRISQGTGIGVLLFPPYTFYFAFFQLEQDGKEIPIATWLFGLVSTILLIFVFWQPINLVMTEGFSAAVDASASPGEAAVEEYVAKESTDSDDEAPADEPEEEPAEEAAPAETTANADAGSAGGDAEAAGANNGTTANAGTTGAAAPAAAQ
jgi:hypothetical protein